MTTINYRINNLSQKELFANTWADALSLQAKTKEEELTQFQFWSIIAYVTNNDGTLTMCAVDENGAPINFDGPYIDNTIAPDSTNI